MNEELMIWFAQAVAHSLWQGLVIGVVCWLLIRCWHKTPARQHLVLCGALFLMTICLPLNLAVLAPEFQQPRAVSGEGEILALNTGAPENSVVKSLPGNLELPLLPPSTMSPSVATTAQPEEAPPTRSAWRQAAPWVVGIYLLGLLLMLVRLAMACGGSRRLRRRITPVTESQWKECIHRAAKRLALHTEPAVRWSGEVAVPVLVGVLKPMILLPVGLANRLSMEQVEAVLTHELAHLRRNDHWVLAVQRVVETILFYHPVIWWLSRELGRTREQACDDLVLAHGSGAADYAETLVICSELRFAHAGLRENAALQLAATGPKGTSLRQRVLRVLGQDDPIRPGKTGWILAALLLGSFLIAGIGLFPEAQAKKPPAAEDLPKPATSPIHESANGNEVHVFEGGEHYIKKLASRVHVVNVGDSLSGIARRYGLELEQLKKLNPQVNWVGLAVGQELLIEAPLSPPILIEVRLAEVPPDYKIDATSMTKEALSKNGKLVAEPKLVGHSGDLTKMETSRKAEIVAPDDPQMISYAVEVTPMLAADGLTFSMKVTRAEDVGQGVKRILSVDMLSEAKLLEWKHFEVGSLLNSKLIGSVRFSHARLSPLKENPRVFHILDDGNVRWHGKDYSLSTLKKALRNSDGVAVISAGKNTPYQEVINLIDVVSPHFDGKIEFATAASVKKLIPPKERKQEARLAEIEFQIAKCRFEVAQFQLALQALNPALEEHKATREKTENNIETATEYIKDLEAEKREIESELVKSGHGSQQRAEIIALEQRLLDLRTTYRDRHPSVQQTLRRLEILRLKDPAIRAAAKARQDWAEEEIVEVEKDLRELRQTHGEKHPSILRLERRKEALETWTQEPDSAPGSGAAPGRSATPLPEGKTSDTTPNATSSALPAATTPDAWEAWYNAIGRGAGWSNAIVTGADWHLQSPHPSSADGEYPLFVPGSPYPAKKPYFAMGMDERLKRQSPNSTIIFLERGSKDPAAEKLLEEKEFPRPARWPRKDPAN